MNKFIRIANELSKLHRQLVSYQLQRDHAIDDIAARALAITPDGGWQGKNESERKTASDKAFAADEIIQKLLLIKRDADDHARQTQAEIDGLEDERRAYEYTVKATYVRAMTEDVTLEELLNIDADIPPVQSVQVDEREWQAWEEAIMPSKESVNFAGLNDLIMTGCTTTEIADITPDEGPDYDTPADGESVL